MLYSGSIFCKYQLTSKKLLTIGTKIDVYVLALFMPELGRCVLLVWFWGAQFPYHLWETHKIWKKVLMVLTNQLIYLVDIKIMKKIFSNYVKSELYQNNLSCAIFKSIQNFKNIAIWHSPFGQNWCFGQFYHSKIEVLHILSPAK